MVLHDLPQGPRPSPEQRELDRHWTHIRDLREQVVEAERQLVDHLQILAAFEHDYLLRCGRRYAELDAIEADIQELEARRDPENEAKARAAREARAKARQTVRDSRAREVCGPSATVVVTPELKATYRQAARLFHPDLGRDDAERSERHDYMVQLNAAYEQGDLERMEHIVVQWRAGTGPEEGRTLGEQLVDAIRIGAQLEERLEQIARERDAADQGDIGRLYRDVQAGLAEGRDPITELIQRLDTRIEDARQRLEALRDA